MKDVRLTHIGGPTVLIEVGGWRLLTDPTFDPPGAKYSFGMGTSSVKLTGPALSVEELGRIEELAEVGVERVMLQHLLHRDLAAVEQIGREVVPAVA